VAEIDTETRAVRREESPVEKASRKAPLARQALTKVDLGTGGWKEGICWNKYEGSINAHSTSWVL
jgi:hypothetical protein